MFVSHAPLLLSSSVAFDFIQDKSQSRVYCVQSPVILASRYLSDNLSPSKFASITLVFLQMPEILPSWGFGIGCSFYLELISPT